MDLFDYKKESLKRDRALDLLEKTRSDLIEQGKIIAMEIWKRKGSVTSPEVRRELFKRKADGVEEVDGRFMGAVFRKNLGWIRTGFVSQGSHAQPISIWSRVK